MEKVLNLYKKLGETPLERLERLKREKPEYKDVPLTYAGRLDPMAEGVLLVLVGEENKKREDYIGLPKEYEFEILWGFETDTFDILGIPRMSQTLNSNPSAGGRNSEQFIDSKLKEMLENYKGKIVQKYPPYSSKPVRPIRPFNRIQGRPEEFEGRQAQGALERSKPLFQWAREGKISEIELPEREVEVYSLEILDNYSIEKPALEKQIIEKISLVKGDFRQDEILHSWKKVFKENSLNIFMVSRFKVSASSGFYVRRLINDLGENLGCGAVTFKILRTKVGEYEIKDSV